MVTWWNLMEIRDLIWLANLDGGYFTLFSLIQNYYTPKKKFIIEVVPSFCDT